MLLNCYRLAGKTWAWLLTDFIPSQDLQWLDTGLNVMADPMKFTAGGWCSPPVEFLGTTPFYSAITPITDTQGKLPCLCIAELQLSR